MKKDTDMSHIKCPACGEVAEEIINAEEKNASGGGVRLATILKRQFFARKG